MLDILTEKAVAISDYAIIVNPDDNVAVVKNETHDGLRVTLVSGETVTIKRAVPPGHRFATREIPAGEFVRQYGQPIGTSLGIEKGEWVTHENMSDDVPVVRDLPDDLHTPAPDYFDASEIETFMGFRRPDGRVGTRNFVLIVPTSMCASHEATQISMMAEFIHYSREKFPNVDGVVAIPHNKGCGCQDGSNLDVMMRTLANYADHPNVGGVILIDLGCEKTNLTFVEKYLTNRDKPIQKPVFKIGIQDVGGTQSAIEIGLKEVEKMLPIVNESVREEFPVSELVLGVKCGSSDGFSGISANPALGYCSDLLV
ncbi:MAG: UxaA family hydrolase, partial [Pyrinomonadaceae bacterium]|nr:UxaA family hydrolase [Pyrinomonadaceae bacterium]